jgi:hypothetical protein
MISIAAAFAAAPVMASADGISAGSLICSVSNETNFIVYSTAKFNCEFTSTSGDKDQYTGTIRKVGVDLSTSKEETLVWLVFAPQSGVKDGALDGNYVGASADASLGIGVGAKILVGGLDRSFSLQPASVSGSVGVGASIGVETLRLKHKG